MQNFCHYFRKVVSARYHWAFSAFWQIPPGIGAFGASAFCSMISSGYKNAWFSIVQSIFALTIFFAPFAARFPFHAPLKTAENRADSTMGENISSKSSSTRIGSPLFPFLSPPDLIKLYSAVKDYLFWDSASSGRPGRVWNF
jgi:hypothetical protein